MSIDWSKPVQTRDGRPVEIITRHGRGRWPVVGYMDKDNYPSTWTACGIYYPGETRFACFDLINVPDVNQQSIVQNCLAGRGNRAVGR